MQTKSLFIIPVFLIFLRPLVPAEQLSAPAWGFSLDLPEGYEYSGGDGKDRFSFENSDGAKFDMSVYHAATGGNTPYADAEALARSVKTRLKSSGEIETFEYRRKKTVLMDLSFTIPGSGAMSGWALCTELGAHTQGGAQNSGALNSTAQNSATRGSGEKRPLLLAMAYGPADKKDLASLHLSALDSLVPEYGDRLFPGPVTEFTYPRLTRVQTPVYGLDIRAAVYEEDAEAAQALIDREFQVLRRYTDAPDWQEAWIRFYRAIYRDSFDRLADIAFQVERKLNIPELPGRDFADKALKWVQSFKYERELMGSDFINLVSAVTEGRGDCDNRAMLWSLVMNQAGIPAAMMVSRHYGHAMGLASLPGAGAHFEVDGQSLLVAETTADVPTGLIGETVSDIEYWLGIPF